MEFIRSVDVQILLWFQSLRRPYLNEGFAVVTELGSSMFLFGLGVLLLFLQGNNWKRAAAAIWIAAFISLHAVALLKTFFAIPRPHLLHLVTPLVTSSGFALPSGHTAMAFSAASVMRERVPSWGPVWFILAALVTVSRIYLGVHYPSDCLVGMLLGAIIGQWVARKLIPVRVPEALDSNA